MWVIDDQIWEEVLAKFSTLFDQPLYVLRLQISDGDTVIFLIIIWLRNLVAREENSLSHESLENLDASGKLQIPLEYFQDVSLHLDEFVESEWTLHELANVFDHWVFDLEVFCTHEQGHTGDECADLLADNAPAAFILRPQSVDAVLDLQEFVVNGDSVVHGFISEAKSLG